MTSPRGAAACGYIAATVEQKAFMDSGLAATRKWSNCGSNADGACLEGASRFQMASRVQPHLGTTRFFRPPTSPPSGRGSVRVNGAQESLAVGTFPPRGDRLQALNVDLVIRDQAADTSTHRPGSSCSLPWAPSASSSAAWSPSAPATDFPPPGVAGSASCRPPVLDRRQLARARRLATRKRPLREIASTLGVSKSAVHRALRS